MVLICLLASEQAIAHVNHYFVESNHTLQKATFDLSTNEKTFIISTKYVQHSVVLLMQKRRVFQNNSFSSAQLDDKEMKVKQSKISTVKTSIDKTKEKCHCLNDCSCNECLCANCPMSISCHAVSITLNTYPLNHVELNYTPVISRTNHIVISQPHATPYRPPITA